MDYQRLSATPAAWMLGARALEPARMDSSYYGPTYLDAMAKLRALPCGFQPFKKLCTKLNCGATPKGVEYGDSGMGLIRTTNVRPNVYDPSDTKRVPGLSLGDTDNRVILPGDVLYTMSGTVGYAAVYPENLESASCSNTIARGRIRPGSGHDPYFVATFLNSSLGYAQSIRLVSGGVLGHVMPNSVKELLVPTPDPDIQRAIGNKLRKAERLRELANEAQRLGVNAMDASCGGLLASTGRTHNFVGRSWLESGRLDSKYYLPAYLELRAALKSMPATTVLGELVKSVSNGCEVREFVDDGRPYVIVGNLSGMDLQVHRAPRIGKDAAAPKKAVATSGDLLVVRTGSIGQASWVLPEDIPVDGIVLSSHIVRIVLKDRSWAPFLAAFLTHGPGRQLIDQIAYGAVQPQVSQDELLALPIPNVATEQRDTIAARLTDWRRALRTAETCVDAAKAAVEALIDGTLDEAALLTESDAIERWLAENPSPSKGA